MADDNTFALSQARSFDDLNQRIAEARASYQSNPFGKPLPELSQSEITPPTSPVQFHVTPGGGSLPWTSIITGAHNAEFPLAAWYKNKVGDQQYAMQKQNAWNKLLQEPYGVPEFQVNTDKAWNGQVMNYSDDKERQYGANKWHDIVEGGARTKQEQEDARNFWIRYQSVNNMASMQRDLGDSYKKMIALQAEGKTLPAGWQDMYHNLAYVAPHLDRMDDEDVMQQYLNVKKKLTALPNLVDVTHKFLENPAVQSEISNAKDAKGNPINDFLQVTKTTGGLSANTPLLDQFSQTMMQSGQINPIDPNPDDTGTVDGMKERMGYWKQWGYNLMKKETEETLHAKPKNMILEKQEQSGETLPSATGQNFDFGEGNTAKQVSAQQSTSITPIEISIGKSDNIISQKTGRSESINLGTGSRINGFANLPAVVIGGKIHVLDKDEVANAKNHIIAPLAIVEEPAQEMRQKVKIGADGKGIPETDAQGNPVMEPNPDKTPHIYYLPLSQASGDIVDKADAAKQKSIKATINDYINTAKDITDQYGSAGDKNYFDTHLMIKETKAPTKPTTVKGYHYAR